MKTASWVILTVLGVAVLGLSLLSAGVAYGSDWPIGPSTLLGLDAAVPGVGAALRGARGTAAGFAAAWAVLFLTIVLGPYRRRETWAWWGILASATVLAAILGLRVPLVGSRLGAGTGLTLWIVVVVGLLFDAGRLSRSVPPSATGH
ncbi:MAG TPA: hypothetical protein VJU18_09005 [Vicinamibacteria bacterium]|nr:hypothetical protein [Vicinamibacteria bacterium]